jgi:hypothetical protein
MLNNLLKILGAINVLLGAIMGFTSDVDKGILMVLIGIAVFLNGSIGGE